MKAALILLLGVAAATAEIPAEFQAGRIVGGSVTTIGQYPFGVAMLASSSGANHRQSCGASILNNRGVATAAHCFNSLSNTAHWRLRVGSTNANSGGVVHTPQQIIIHPQYNRNTNHMDVAIVRIVGNFVYNNNVQPASIAGPNYNVADNQVVWAIGWGTTAVGGGGPSSEQLRHVQIWTVNQNICAQRYAARGLQITAAMLCSGWLDVGGRDQCQGDSGGPLLHNRIVVGICSWGRQCALAHYPGVNARVSSASSWIQANA